MPTRLRLCCPGGSGSAPSQSTVYDIEAAKSQAVTPPLPRPKGYMNRNKQLFAILGPFHRRVLSEFFGWLMDKPLSVLVIFIGMSIFVMTLVFWPFYAFLVDDFVQSSSNDGTNTVLDAFVVSFGSLFSQSTHWKANNSASVFLITLHGAIGKVTLSGLTALLVMKVSRVPNHLIVTDALLIHKHDGDWHISLRLGTLYYQVVHGCTARLVVSFRDPATNLKRFTLLPFSSDRFNTNFSIQGPMPVNLRCHLPSSALRAIDFDSEDDVREVISNFMLTVHGFDETTGRSLGLVQRYKWSDSTCLYEPGAAMDDVLVKLTNEQKRQKKKSWGVKFTSFNGVKLEQKNN